MKNRIKKDFSKESTVRPAEVFPENHVKDPLEMKQDPGIKPQAEPTMEHKM